MEVSQASYTWYLKSKAASTSCRTSAVSHPYRSHTIKTPFKLYLYPLVIQRCYGNHLLLIGKSSTNEQFCTALHGYFLDPLPRNHLIPLLGHQHFTGSMVKTWCMCGMVIHPRESMGWWPSLDFTHVLMAHMSISRSTTLIHETSLMPPEVIVADSLVHRPTQMSERHFGTWMSRNQTVVETSGNIMSE